MTQRADEFDSLMAELARTEGARLLRENERWRDRVPERADTAAKAALLSVAAGVGLAAARRGAAVPPVKSLAIALTTLLAAGAVTGGALIASPALRELAADALHPASAPAETAQTQNLSPADYVIPAPGPDYTEQESAESENLQYRWFVSGEKAALVEIARRLPEGTGLPGDAEPVVIGRLVGWAYEQDGAQYLLLRDGQMSILMSMNHGDRDDLLDYAAAFAAANGG